MYHYQLMVIYILDVCY